MATTQKKPARAPRKPARASEPVKGGNRTRKPATGRQAKTLNKPNPFDDIARQVIADQEAKDREAGQDDLIPALAKSVDQAKAKRSGTSRAATKPAKPARPTKPATPAKLATPAKPTRPTKVQANGNGVAFGGRPTTKVETVSARVKQLGLRVRADADVDVIAARLRATPDAVSAWLATRNGAPTKTPTKATTKQPAKAAAKPKQVKPDKAPTITLGHVWDDKKPDWLYRCTLVTRYEVHPDGSVWSTLHQVLGPDGKVLEDIWRLPLDFRPTQEVQGNGRKVVLKGRTIAGLQTWLVKQGLTTPEDITV